MSRVRIGDITTSCLGKMLDAEKNKGQYEPYLANINVRWGSFDLSNLQMMRFEPDEQERYGLKDGDLIMCEGGEPGRCAIWRSIVPDMKIQKALHRIRAKEGTDIVYLYYWFLYAGKNHLIDGYFTGSTIKHLPGDQLKLIELELPKFEIQTKISSVLSSIDRTIDNNTSINSDLESMAKLLYDYWFVQFDFPDEKGKPYKSSGGKMVWNEELKREIPDGWKLVPYGYCIESINTGLNPRDNFILNTGGSIKYLTVKNLTKAGMIDFSSCDFVDENARNIIHRRSDIQIGDVLFASIAPLGRCYIIMDNPTDWDINESVFSIRPNKENMTSTFLYMSFTSDSFIKMAEGSSTGSVFKGIRIATLQGMKTILPPKPILDNFDKQVKMMFSRKASAIEENQQLSSLRDFLLPMLMNGQVQICE